MFAALGELFPLLACFQENRPKAEKVNLGDRHYLCIIAKCSID